MVHPKVTGLFLPDLRLDLSDYEPPDPRSFGVRVQAFIAPTDSGTGDSFDFVVCTPSWLAKQFETAELGRWNEGVLFANSAFAQLAGSPLPRTVATPDPDWPLLGTGFVFVRRWDAATLRTAIDDLCARSVGSDWFSSASALGRWLPWEFAGRRRDGTHQ